MKNYTLLLVLLFLLSNIFSQSMSITAAAEHHSRVAGLAPTADGDWLMAGLYGGEPFIGTMQEDILDYQYAYFLDHLNFSGTIVTSDLQYDSHLDRYYWLVTSTDCDTSSGAFLLFFSEEIPLIEAVQLDYLAFSSRLDVSIGAEGKVLILGTGGIEGHRVYSYHDDELQLLYSTFSNRTPIEVVDWSEDHFLLRYADGVQLVDYSTPNQPEVVAEWEQSDVASIVKLNDSAVVVSNSESLVQLDQELEITSTLDLSDIGHLTVDANTIYALSHDSLYFLNHELEVISTQSIAEMRAYDPVIMEVNNGQIAVGGTDRLPEGFLQGNLRFQLPSNLFVKTFRIDGEEQEITTEVGIADLSMDRVVRVNAEFPTECASYRVEGLMVTVENLSNATLSKVVLAASRPGCSFDGSFCPEAYIQHALGVYEINLPPGGSTVISVDDFMSGGSPTSNFSLCVSAFSSLGTLEDDVENNSSCLQELVVKTNDVDPLSILQLWPNPAKDVVLLSIPNHLIRDRPHANLFNAQGVLIDSYRLDSSMTSIDMNELPAGVYLFQVEEAPFVKRIIKQ